MHTASHSAAIHIQTCRPYLHSTSAPRGTICMWITSASWLTTCRSTSTVCMQVHQQQGVDENQALYAPTQHESPTLKDQHTWPCQNGHHATQHSKAKLMHTHGPCSYSTPSTLPPAPRASAMPPHSLTSARPPLLKSVPITAPHVPGPSAAGAHLHSRHAHSPSQAAA